LNIDINKIDSVILSHGHFDHIGGLMDFYNHVSREIPLVLHPDAFLERRLNNPSEGTNNLPILNENDLKEAGAKIIKSQDPYTLASDLILLTGEVERTITFEQGFPWAEAKINGVWKVDLFRDDQSVIIKLKDKYLVIISGCAHAGIINTIRHSMKITQTKQVHAVLGGFHLTGPLFKEIIPPIIEEMKKINPDYF
jgi:7,8-dihydropterin-6-yl-methyl-4-(beta-D-ribofuranosyl)aminobenzene 5'-phosphate synthase